MSDPVNHPSHYTAGKVECIDALEAATVNLTGIEAVCTANAIKYLWRWKQKNGTEDLKKARWYIDRLLPVEAAALVLAAPIVHPDPASIGIEHLKQLKAAWRAGIERRFLDRGGVMEGSAMHNCLVSVLTEVLR